MLKKEIDIAMEFLQTEPELFAALLEKQDIKDVAIFLKNVPHNNISTIVSYMTPQYSSKLCELLGVETAAKILANINYNDLSFILRCFSSKFRIKILNKLSMKTKAACNLLLHYPEYAAGSRMKLEIITALKKSDVQDALLLFSDPNNQIDSNVLFVVDRHNHFEGMINLSTLIKSSFNGNIETLVEKNVEPILGGAELTNVLNHDSWLLYDQLPVINKNRQLIGVLKHMDLRKSNQEVLVKESAAGACDPIVGIYKTYGNILVTLFNTALNLAKSKSS